MTNTSNYYDQHANEFFQSTFQVDMQEIYAPFLSDVVPGGRILDLGCGSGRDALAFKQLGYQVEATDYSVELVEKARAYTGINVRLESFYALDQVNQYDAIWACASLLHCERQRLSEVFGNIYRALKTDAVCYMSFKYGDCDRSQAGREFTDLNEQQAAELLAPLNIELLKQWITQDKRPDRDEKWLNILFKKLS